MICFDDYFNKKNLYCFSNCWIICAPACLVWNGLTHLEQWPAWFHGLERIQPSAPIASLERGQAIELMIRGHLPYSLKFEMVVNDFIAYSFVSFTVKGDLNGEGFCQLLPSENGSIVHFTWNVSPARLWMKMGASIARTVFIKNHDQIVERSINGFKRWIAEKAIEVALPVAGPGPVLNRYS